MARTKEYLEMLPKLYPTFFSLCESIGYGEIRRRFFDANGNVKDNAPRGLKDEIVLMRKDNALYPDRVNGETVRY